MEKHLVKIVLTVEVEAFGKEDAIEAVNDALGEGEGCGIMIVESEIIDYERLV